MPAVVERPTPEDRIRAALWFAEHGFGVFTVWSADDDGVCRCPKGPDCDNPGKHPIPRRGFLDATSDPAKIRTLLTAGSEPNYGLVCPDGVFALDVDGEGLTRLEELEQMHGQLPETLSTTTANGRHIFLRWPADVPRPIGHLFGFVTRWGTGRDAGYVIGPRSVHASGAAYAPAGVAAIAELPDSWAHAAVERPGATGGPLITVGYALPEVVDASQSRYEAIRGYTAHLYNRGLSIPEMWPLVRDMLGPRFAERLTERELRSRFDRCVADLPARLGPPRATEQQSEPVDVSTFPLPEDRGGAVLSDLGEVEYVNDLVRPGRIVVWAAEEGSGKSYAVAGELAIRLAAAGGVFAETWSIETAGPVLVLSEMHPDDDYHREEIVLASLGLDRAALAGRYWRLDLMTAAGGRPALTVPEWRAWATAWMQEHGVLLLVVDTVTGATQVDPWGREIQQVYQALRMMLGEYRQLAVMLVVHMRKPDGHADDRPISDVLGEWGRWCDVVVLQENEGLSLEKTKITTRKRVAQQRRIVATKRGGLLVDVQLIEAGGRPAKVGDDEVLAAIEDEPGMTTSRLAEVLGVDTGTASRYVSKLGDMVRTEAGPRRSKLLYASVAKPADDVSQDTDASVAKPAKPPRNTRQNSPISGVAGAGATVVLHEGAPLKGGFTPSATQQSHDSAARARNTQPEPEPTALPVGSSTGEWVAPCQDYTAHRSHHRRTAAGWVCDICNPEATA